MKKVRKRWNAAVLAGGIAILGITGCSGQRDAAETVGKETEVSAAETASMPDETSEADGASGAADGEGAVKVQLGEGKEKEIAYGSEDLETEWDENQVTGITFHDQEASAEGKGASVKGTTVTITEPGTYVVSGVSKDGQIRIDADDTALVHLVLNGIELSNTTSAPIYGMQKCKVVLTLEPGTKNVIQDGAEYQFENAEEDEPDAAIFTKGDLTINGTGELEVDGNYQCGIRSKGNLKIVSGVLTIRAQQDGLKGKESVVIRDGLFTIRAGKDGIKANQDDDENAGYVWIDGGDITIEAEDDAVQAETALIVNGGEITITKCQEGLAGKTVDILGGLIKAQTEDDGINSAASVETEMEKMQDQEGVYTRIAGGEIWLNTMADGIDSNGDLYIEGGTLYLTGPESQGDGILDYNGAAYLSGGTVFAAGKAGMMQTFDESSTQNYIVMYYPEIQKQGTLVSLTDAAGTDLGSYAPEKDFEVMIISSPQLQAGSTYQVTTGEETAELSIDGTETISGEAPQQEGRGPGPEGSGQGPGMNPKGRGEEPGMNPEGRGEGEKRPEWDGKRPEHPAGGGKNPEQGTAAGTGPDRDGAAGTRPDQDGAAGTRPDRDGADGDS